MELQVFKSPATVDHVVINALFELDAARDIFSSLGFTVSERGYHSLGSMNHLIMTEGAYLELVGVPKAGLQRADVLNSPLGLSGLVLKSESAEGTFTEMQDHGLQMLPPLAFSRPVTLNGQEHEARFKIVRSQPEQFPAGRIYFCQHLTPELVWNGQGTAHANGFQRLVRTNIHSTQLAQENARYLALTSAEGANTEQAICIELSDSSITLESGTVDCFASVELEFEALAPIEAAAAKLAEVEWQRVSEHQGMLSIPALKLQMACTARASHT